MNEINVVPYIDVMLVLLVIFMVTAPMIQPGSVDLPTVGKSSLPPVAPLTRHSPCATARRAAQSRW
jgi:biopolymer transport protein TolR